MSVMHTWRSFLRQLENIDFESKLRLLRRYPRRRIAVVALVIIFFIFVFTRSSKPADTQTKLQQCSQEKLRHWNQAIQDFDLGINENSVEFVGNGYFGLDSTGQLRMQSSPTSRVLDVEMNFFPAFSIEIDTSSTIEHTTITDFKNGVAKIMKCFTLDGECACITSSTYAHRTRPNVFVQTILVSNPTKSTVRANLNRLSSNWWAKTKSGELTVHQRQLGNASYAVVCTDPVGKVIIAQKREESFRYTCSITSKQLGEDPNRELKVEAVKIFTDTRDVTSLDAEHNDGWNKLNIARFSVSPSKAPNTLNGDRINATKYILLSNLRAPTIEHGANLETVKMLESVSRKSELCYTGHSNLLYPSRLWRDWDKPSKIVELVNAWILTFEKRGCANLLKTGAFGASQAFVQSLSASSYHDSHLEVALDAHDLHREMSFSGIPVHSSLGTLGTIDVDIKLDSENRPYFMVSSTNQLFACDGGCLDKPVSLGRTPTRLPVKVTKPVTSLLYVATNRRHLEQLKSAIHVSEVGAAPAHEDEVIELHKTGGASNGLPTSFWVFLVVVLIAFHLFLAKVFWNEWSKGDMTPYNPYLRNRYSLRPH